MNSVHQDGPVLFKTRWTLSYLRGPLTRDQIKRLMDPIKNQAKDKDVESSGSLPNDTLSHSNAACADSISERPTLDPALRQYFAPVKFKDRQGEVFYEAQLLASANLRFLESKPKLDWLETRTFLVPFKEEALTVDWNDATRVKLDIAALAGEPIASARFKRISLPAAKAANYKAWSKQFLSWLANCQKIFLLKSSILGEFSKPNESEREFRIRLLQIMNEARDQSVSKLRQKYASKLANVTSRVEAARSKLQGAIEQAKEQDVQSAISIGTTVLGAILSGKINNSTINKAGGAVKSASKSGSRRVTVSNQETSLESLQQEKRELEEEISSEIEAIRAKFDAQAQTFETISFTAKKTQISLQLFGLVWLPYVLSESGQREQVW